MTCRRWLQLESRELQPSFTGDIPLAENCWRYSPKYSYFRAWEQQQSLGIHSLNLLSPSVFLCKHTVTCLGGGDGEGERHRENKNIGYNGEFPFSEIKAPALKFFCLQTLSSAASGPWSWTRQQEAFSSVSPKGRSFHLIFVPPVIVCLPAISYPT